MDRITSEYTREEPYSGPKRYPQSNGYWTDKDGNIIKNPRKCDNPPPYWHLNGTHKGGNTDINPPKPREARKYKKEEKKQWCEIVAYYNDAIAKHNINHKGEEGFVPVPLPWDGSVPFNEDGVPDLSVVSRGEVKVDMQLYGTNILKNSKDDGRYDNFKLANAALGDKLNPKRSPEEVEAWMEENGYTWHEMDETGNMQKVPSAVHGCISHNGGVNMFKSLHKEGKLDGFEFSADSNEMTPPKKGNKKRNKK